MPAQSPEPEPEPAPEVTRLPTPSATPFPSSISEAHESALPEDPCRRRWQMWLLLVLGALPVLYVLSVPVVENLAFPGGKRPVNFISTGVTPPPTPDPAWLTAYMMPWNWLVDATPMRGALTVYAAWCHEWLAGARGYL